VLVDGREEFELDAGDDVYIGVDLVEFEVDGVLGNWKR
jgi:hypothetical protein